MVRHLGPEEAEYRDAWRQFIWTPDPEKNWSGFTPTPTQWRILADDIRFKMVAGGVRSGKSQMPPRAVDIVMGVEGAVVWIIGPDYVQTRKEFDYLLEPYLKLGLCVKDSISKPRDGAWAFDVQGGAAVMTKSADTLEKIAGEAPDFILVTEIGQHHQDIIDKVMERTLEKYSPAMFTGTFEGAISWYPDKWQEWRDGIEDWTENTGYKSYSMPTSSNIYVFPEGENDPRFAEYRKNTSHGVYLERYDAIPNKPSGLVFRDEYDSDRHVVADMVPLPGRPVELAIDPAYHTYAVEFVQWDGERVYVLDEVYRHEATTQDIIPLVKNHWLWPLVTGGVCDIAGKQHHANTSVIEMWNRLAKIDLRSSRISIQDGIDVWSLRLKDGPDGKPNLLISDRCGDGRDNVGRAMGLLAELDMYAWPPFRPSGNTVRKPKDKYNDAIKAVGYWLYDKYGLYRPEREEAQLEQYMAYPWKQKIWSAGAYNRDTRMRMPA